MRASTEDSFIIPEGWEAMEVTQDILPPHLEKKVLIIVKNSIKRETSMIWFLKYIH